MKIDCPCGTAFTTTQNRIETGRGKYCSKPCMYRFRTRPSGLKYELKVENPTWIKPGERLSPSTEFQKGQTPHNWSGDNVGYDSLHDWVKRHAGAAFRCQFCGSEDNVQWANKSWEYKRDISDWMQLCYQCHRAYDMAGEWGAAAKLFEKRKSGGYGKRLV